jgi:hypothetical protein
LIELLTVPDVYEMNIVVLGAGFLPRRLG